MKKRLAMCLLGCLLTSITAWAYDFEINGVYYNITDANAKTVEVTYVDLGVGNKDFYYGSVTIPNRVSKDNVIYDVTGIGYAAFAGCSGLTSITIPNSVTSIGNWAFSRCNGLISVTIPQTVTSIGNYAFERCSGLTSVTIPKNVTSIGDYAFQYCSGLTSITISNGVTNIGDNAFQYCSGLTSITIPNSVISIGNNTFFGCGGLTSIMIPNSVTSIGHGAFQNWQVTTIVVSEENTVYDSRNNCNAIIESNTNKLIAGCKNTIIPNDVTSIGDWAFYNCSGLTSITIPNSVTSIGDNAFRGCTGLTSVTIPNSVTSIGNAAYLDCSGLTSVTIPNSVTSIGTYAFSGCSHLTSATTESSNPVAITEKVFTNRANATLYVPAGSKAAYQAADYWKEFNEIVEVIKIGNLSTQSNALYIEPISACKGGNINIQVKLKNSGSVTSYGLDLVLPEGITIATDDGGSFDSEVTLSNRHASNHAATTNKVSDNVYKIGVASLNSKTLSGNDGAVLTIRAHVAEGMEIGEYPIIVRSPLIVNSNGTKPEVCEMRSKVTIDDYQKGDVDGDGVIDLADAVLVINHYVGKPVTNFIENAADVDGDHVIDLADAVLIINYYVGKIPSLSRETEETEQEPQ